MDPERRIASNTMNQITIVVVAYKRVPMTLDCLRGIPEACGSLPYRIELIDNARSEDLRTAVESPEFPRLRYQALDRNVGFGRANNVALRRLETNCVLLLNPDTILPPHSIERAHRELWRRESVGALGVKLLRTDGTVDHAAKRGFPTLKNSLGYFASKVLPRRLAGHLADGYTSGHMSPETPGSVDAINGAFMFIKSKALKDAGLFDESYWMYGEDLDLCYRLHRSGWDVFYWPEVHVTHIKAGTTGSNRKLRSNIAFHNAMWIFYRAHVAKDHSSPVNGLVALSIFLKLLLSSCLSMSKRVFSSRRRAL